MKTLPAQESPTVPQVTNREAGIAMVIAVAVIMLVSAVVATILVLVLRENGLSGRERQRAVSIASAEGQVDDLVSRIDHAYVSSLTNTNGLCGTIPAFASRVGRDDLTITSTVMYYRADGSQIMNCDDVASGAAEAQMAAVRATTTSTPLPNKAPVVRHFETIINLHLNVNMKQAIFGNTGVTITNNNTVVNGENGANNGDVYSNGYVNCRGKIYGSVYAGTTVTFENDCDWIAGDVWAGGNVTANANSMTMVGDIKSSGNILLNQLGAQANKVFGGKAWANGTVSGSACPGPKCNSIQSLSPPPTANFPHVTDAGWTDPVTSTGEHGYTEISFLTCVADFNDPTSLGYWLKNNGPTLTQKTLVRMPDECTVDFTNVNGQVMYLNKDVAIFARGINANGLAFNITGRPHFVGTPGDLKNLYFIQDWQTPQSPQCSKVGIDVNNHITANENIRLLMYTPNKFYSAAGNSDIMGQIFSGCVVEINNVMDLTYSLLPIDGIQNINSMSYSAEIVAKRETS